MHSLWNQLAALVREAKEAVPSEEVQEELIQRTLDRGKERLKQKPA